MYSRLFSERVNKVLLYLVFRFLFAGNLLALFNRPHTDGVRQLGRVGLIPAGNPVADDT